jgi:hypothetical protein
VEYIHIRNLEKYHPKYKDRSLIWCKAYFSMLNSDPDFEMLCETDKWRFLALIMLELQLKKEIPLDEAYLQRKGFDLEKRPISKTIQMLHTLIEIRTPSVTQSRVEYIEKSRVDVDKEIDKIKNTTSFFLKEKFLDFVLLTQEEYDKLVAQFGEQGTNERIARLNEYGHQKPRKFKEYGSHYHTILVWARKDLQNTGSNLTKQQRSNLQGLQKLMKEIDNDKQIIPAGICGPDSSVPGA